MVTKVTIKHTSINGGEPVKVYCTEVNVIYGKNIDGKPNANYDTEKCSRVQSLSLENPKYNLLNVKLGEGGLTFELLQQFYKLPNDDSDPIILNVVYGTKDSLSNSSPETFKDLVGFDGVTTDIPVTVTGNLNVPFNTTDSRHAYMPSFGIMFKEVRKVE